MEYHGKPCHIFKICQLSCTLQKMRAKYLIHIYLKYDNFFGSLKMRAKCLISIDM